MIVFVHNPPVFQEDVGIDPLLIFHEGWRCLPDTVIAPCSPQVDVVMNEDHDHYSESGMAQNTMTL